MWFLSSYLAAWLTGDYRCYVCGTDCDLYISQWEGGLVLTATATVLIAAAFAHFRQRDLI